MSRLDPGQLDRVHEAVQANLTAVADAMRAALEPADDCRLEPADPVPLGDGPGVTGPGLVVIFDHGPDRFAVLVPEGELLPDWYRLPDDDQDSRLRTLAVEWSLCFLPAEFEADHTEARAVADLAAFVAESNPSPGSTVRSLSVRTNAEDDPTFALRFVGPLESGVVEPAPPAERAESTTSDDGSARLLPLVVPISVRLAEKSIDVDQFVNLIPGGLVTFDKNCEDPLELYVGNQLYARGEAVKIGEKFGLKIDEIGVVRERVSNVFHG